MYQSINQSINFNLNSHKHYFYSVEKEEKVRYSHCSKRCWISVSSVSFSRAVNVSFNKVSVVVVFVINTFKISVFVS